MEVNLLFAVFSVFLHPTKGLPVTNANIGIVSGIFIPAETFDNLIAQSNQYTNKALESDTLNQIRGFSDGVQPGHDIKMNPIILQQQPSQPNVVQQGNIQSQIDFNQVLNQPAPIQDPIIVKQQTQPQQIIVNPYPLQTITLQRNVMVQQVQKFDTSQDSLPLTNQQLQPMILVQPQQPSLISNPQYYQELLHDQKPNQDQALIVQQPNQQNAIGQKPKQQIMTANQLSNQPLQIEQRSRTEPMFNIQAQNPQPILVSQHGQQMVWANPQGQQAILITQPSHIPYGSRTVTVVGQTRNQAILLSNPSDSNIYTLLITNNQNQNQ